MLWYLKVPLPNTLVAYKVTDNYSTCSTCQIEGKRSIKVAFHVHCYFCLCVLGRLLIWSLLSWCYKAICLLFIDVKKVLSSTQFHSALSGNGPLMWTACQGTASLQVRAILSRCNRWSFVVNCEPVLNPRYLMESIFSFFLQFN